MTIRVGSRVRLTRERAKYEAEEWDGGKCLPEQLALRGIVRTMVRSTVGMLVGFELDADFLAKIDDIVQSGNVTGINIRHIECLEEIDD